MRYAGSPIARLQTSNPALNVIFSATGHLFLSLFSTNTHQTTVRTWWLRDSERNGTHPLENMPEVESVTAEYSNGSKPWSYINVLVVNLSVQMFLMKLHDDGNRCFPGFEYQEVTDSDWCQMSCNWMAGAGHWYFCQKKFEEYMRTSSHLHTFTLHCLFPIIEELCSKLREINIPMTLVHDDFYLTNVAHESKESDNLIFYDWGFAYIGHSFFEFHRIHEEISDVVRDEYLKL